MFDHEYINPIVEIPPQQAFYSEKKSVPIEESNGMICGEFVMCYPPGIPILAPGEKITSDILNYIAYCKEILWIFGLLRNIRTMLISPFV